MTTPFPHLDRMGYTVTSPFEESYNCIAWAAGDDTRCWWPVDSYYWPSGVAAEETISAFIEMFETLGFSSCSNANLDPGYEKVAIYADQNRTPTHAARQLPTGAWTSKLGKGVDLSHELDAVTGPLYGQVVQYMHRPTS